MQLIAACHPFDRFLTVLDLKLHHRSCLVYLKSVEGAFGAHESHHATSEIENPYSVPRLRLHTTQCAKTSTLAAVLKCTPCLMLNRALGVSFSHDVLWGIQLVRGLIQVQCEQRLYRPCRAPGSLQLPDLELLCPRLHVGGAVAIQSILVRRRSYRADSSVDNNYTIR